MAEEVAGSSPESPEIPDGQVSVFQSLQAKDPAQLGGYTLVARLGAGGMGKVYLSHTRAGRPVAIKAIRPELADDPAFRRRFRQEVAAARRVHGLYTAPVIDSEIDTPPLWLATAFVQGPTLSVAVSRHGTLPVPSVLLLAAGVAEALEAVHGEGIVHRDLKASNVLLASDGPRVIDFGIARAIDATTLTSTGIAVGTPPFMSPEQALNKDVGPATDIFSLGQLITYAVKGTPAFGEGQSYGVLFRIVYEEPDLSGVPEALLPLLNRCLAKDPAERPSPADVIDLCRAASEDGMLRRTGNWLPETVTTDITRHQDVPQQRLGDSQLEGVSEIAADTAQPHTRTASPGPSTSAHGASPWAAVPPPPASHRSAPPPPPENSKPEIPRESPALAADGDGQPSSADTPQPGPKPIRRRSFLALGTTVLAGAGGTTAVISLGGNGYALKSAKPLTGHKGGANRVVFSPDSKTLATTGYEDENVSLWNAETREHIKELTGHKGGATDVVLSPDGKTLAIAGFEDENVSLWDMETHERTKIPTRHKDGIEKVVFSLDSKTIATMGYKAENVSLWDTETREHIKELTGHKGGATDVVLSPDGKTLATAASEDENVSLWDMETHERTKIPTRHKDGIEKVVFSSDGKTLATTGYEDENVSLWNTETHEHTKIPTRHKDGIEKVVFSPDGKTLATAASEDENVSLWNTETHEHIKELTGHKGGATDVVLSPDGKTLATAGYKDESVFLWDMETRERAKIPTRHKDGVIDVAFSPDGKILAISHGDMVHLWKASGNAPISAARIKKRS